MRKKFLPLIVALLAFPWPVHAGAAIGQPAPALVVTQFDGQTFDLAAQRGKVVIVNFWATWCAPCREEMPALDAAYKKYRARGLTMIGVSADRARHRGEAIEAMKKFGYPAALMEDAKTNGFGAPDTLPVTYVIDAAGIVRARLTPDQTPLTEVSLARALEPLLPKSAAVDKHP